MARPTGSINLDPFAAHSASNSYTQQQQQPNRQMPVGNMNQGTGYQQPSMGMTAMGAPMGGMAMQLPQQQQGMRGSFTGQQAVAPGGAGNGNYNISQLMNPASLQTGQQNLQSKSINIDPFASLGR